jgi:hypothetical protein
MTRSISAGLKADLAEEYTALATLAKIERRDGQFVYVTDWDQEIVYDGNTYSATGGFDRTALEQDEGTGVNDVDFRALLDSAILDEDDLRNGIYNYAKCTLYAINPLDTAQGVMVIQEGLFGPVKLSARGYFEVTIRSKTERLRVKQGRILLPQCWWDLGDSNCRVPVNPDVRLDSTDYVVGDFVKVATTAGTGSVVYQNRIYECTVAGTTAGTPPSFNITPGATTVDGTVTWTAYEAWTRTGTVATVASKKQFTVTLTESRAVDDWFSLGGLVFETGDNLVDVQEIRDWTQSSSTILLAIPAKQTIQVGDLFRIWPGCNRVLTDHCKSKFAMASSVNFADGNGKRHGGFHYLPGRKVLLKTPNPT